MKEWSVLVVLAELFISRNIYCALVARPHGHANFVQIQKTLHIRIRKIWGFRKNIRVYSSVQFLTNYVIGSET
jgi:hypothetical protein